MNKLFLAAIAALFLVNVSLAATDTVMLVTDMTSVDTATASAAADKAGVPVLVLENGLLTDQLKADLQSQGFRNVVLVGGAVVIKPQVESELRSLGYSVVRVWGFERTGTAVAVARYFWPEGASCAVLVDDTKNSDADSRRQQAASQLAARFNCTLVPVPEGTVPIDVLALMHDLGIKDIHFVGKRVSLEARQKLAAFSLREIVGSDEEVERAAENETLNATRKPKLVIVAAPDWKAAIAIGSHPSERSVVKHLFNTSRVPGVVAFIQAHNITDVRVVGLPGLAQQIADQLAAAGINVTKITGQKASEISREVLNRVKGEWTNLSAAEDANKIRFRLKIKAQIEGDINETLTRLDAALAELDAKEQTADTENAKTAIEAAKARITEVKSKIQSGDFDGAQRLLFEIKMKADEKKFELKDRLKIRIEDHVKDEENDIDEAQSDVDQTLAAAESRLSIVRNICSNTDIVDAIIAKAKSLRTSMQDAKASGNFTGASQHLVQVRELVNIAKSAVEARRQHGTIPAVATNVTAREKIAIARTTSSGTSSSTQGFNIEADDNGFYTNGQKIDSISTAANNETKILFTVRRTSVSFGGLDFRSPEFSTLKLKPGASGSVSFKAEASFNITSYWPDSNVEKAALEVKIS